MTFMIINLSCVVGLRQRKHEISLDEDLCDKNKTYELLVTQKPIVLLSVVIDLLHLDQKDKRQ